MDLESTRRPHSLVTFGGGLLFACSFFPLFYIPGWRFGLYPWDLLDGDYFVGLFASVGGISSIGSNGWSMVARTVIWLPYLFGLGLFLAACPKKRPVKAERVGTIVFVVMWGALIVSLSIYEGLIWKPTVSGGVGRTGLLEVFPFICLGVVAIVVIFVFWRSEPNLAKVARKAKILGACVFIGWVVFQWVHIPGIFAYYAPPRSTFYGFVGACLAIIIGGFLDMLQGETVSKNPFSPVN